MKKIAHTAFYLCLLASQTLAQAPRVELKEQYRSSDTPYKKTQILLKISQSFYGQDFDSARWYAQQAIEESKSLSNDSLYYMSKVYHAIFDIEAKDTVGVKATLLDAINYQTKNSYYNQLTVSYNTLGNLYHYAGQHEEALKAYQKSIDFEELRGNRLGMALSKLNLGFLLQRMNRYNAAYESMHFSHSVLKEVNDSANLIRSFVNLADLFIDKNERVNPIFNPDCATAYAFKALEYSRSLKFKFGEMMSLDILTASLLENNSCEEALSYLDLQYSQFEKLMENSQVNNLMFKRSKAFFCLNQPEQSIAELKKLYSSGHDLESVNMLLAKSYEQLGQTDLALIHFKEYQQILDSIYYESTSVKLAELQTKYETEKKDNEIATLSQQAQIQALEISQRNNQLIGAGILLLVLILAGVVVNQQRKFKHQQAVSDMEQRMLRLQMNPHFIFNALASIQNFILQSNTKESVSYLAKFGKLMRQILEHSREEFISISEETDMLKNYIEIQQLRFKNSFDFSIELDPSFDPEEMKIPPLFAQPFVENAIEHGLKDKKADGMLSIRFKPDGNNVLLEVEDNGSGINTTANTGKEHKSLATRITKERLVIFEKKFGLTLPLNVQSQEKGTLASMLLPAIS
ncbi:MAG: histidine kinase [Cyclobacteriaceae bacterium]